MTRARAGTRAGRLVRAATTHFPTCDPDFAKSPHGTVESCLGTCARARFRFVSCARRRYRSPRTAIVLAFRSSASTADDSTFVSSSCAGFARLHTWVTARVRACGSRGGRRGAYSVDRTPIRAVTTLHATAGVNAALQRTAQHARDVAPRHVWRPVDRGRLFDGGKRHVGGLGPRLSELAIHPLYQLRQLCVVLRVRHVSLFLTRARGRHARWWRCPVLPPSERCSSRCPQNRATTPHQ